LPPGRYAVFDVGRRNVQAQLGRAPHELAGKSLRRDAGEPSRQDGVVVDARPERVERFSRHAGLFAVTGE
jgi:hypothetical protein